MTTDGYGIGQGQGNPHGIHDWMNDKTRMSHLHAVTFQL